VLTPRALHAEPPSESRGNDRTGGNKVVWWLQRRQERSAVRHGSRASAGCPVGRRLLWAPASGSGTRERALPGGGCVSCGGRATRARADPQCAEPGYRGGASRAEEACSFDGTHHNDGHDCDPSRFAPEQSVPLPLIAWREADALALHAHRRDPRALLPMGAIGMGAPAHCLGLAAHSSHRAIETAARSSSPSTGFRRYDPKPAACTRALLVPAGTIAMIGTGRPRRT